MVHNFHNNRQQGQQNDHHDCRRKVFFHHGNVPEKVPESHERGNPNAGAHDVVQRKLGIVHLGDAGDKRRERSHDDKKASENDLILAKNSSVQKCPLRISGTVI